MKSERTNTEQTLPADRLRAVVAQELQVALVPHASITTEAELIKAADTALYEAKRRGRDRSVVFGDLTSLPEVERP